MQTKQAKKFKKEPTINQQNQPNIFPKFQPEQYNYLQITSL